MRTRAFDECTCYCAPMTSFKFNICLYRKASGPKDRKPALKKRCWFHLIWVFGIKYLVSILVRKSDVGFFLVHRKQLLSSLFIENERVGDGRRHGRPGGGEQNDGERSL